jgi:signal transduction histidine kinase/DNA-binding response OmpR family regulator
MRPDILQRFDQWISQKLTLPEDTKETIDNKRTFFYTNLIVPLVISVLTTMTYTWDLPILTSYGVGLICFGVFILGAFLALKRIAYWFFIANQIFVILLTAVTIIRLGGIPYSGGLIFAQLATIVYSLNLPSKRLAWWSIGLFLLATLIETILSPWLLPAPEMTPRMNFIFYAINGSWISLFMLLVVFHVFSQKEELERARLNRLKAVNEFKTRMFANIAHEFRTPLTLIGSMAELIQESPQQHRERAKIIQHNASKVLNLVNQMLNLAQLEAGATQVHSVQSDIVAFLQYVLNSFSGLAEYRQIKLHFLSAMPAFKMDFDPEKLEGITNNLLSNALKYTPPGGDVYLQLSLSNETPARFVIKVKDTGIGIPADQLDAIFERFYRIEETQQHYEEGSGIGLTLVREYVKLMEGTIQVSSSYGTGSEFTVTVPVTHQGALQEEIIGHGIADVIELPDSVPGHLTTTDRELPVLLVVEDNPELVHYLQIILGPKFRLLVALNGKEGVELALEKMPDLILSDVMMPVMDGYELCHTLKNDFRTCHIPIVLLTARTDTSSRIKGLEKGADAYLGKPFNKRELLTCLRNLFTQREKLRIKYSSINLDSAQEPTPGLDALFIQKVRDILEKNYMQEHFGIENLQQEMGISRVQLHRKLVALTGLSASHFIRSFRLDKAKNLLRTTSKSVSEVAYETGFNDANYFSRVFAQEVGHAPSDYRKGPETGK